MDEKDRLIADLRAENAELKRIIERQQIHASVLGTDTLRKYDEAIERLQKERDEARKLAPFAGWSNPIEFFSEEQLAQWQSSSMLTLISSRMTLLDIHSGATLHNQLDTGYPGTLEQAKQDFQTHLLPLLRRAPLPEDRTHKGLKMVLPDEVFDRLMLVLSPYFDIETQDVKDGLQAEFNQTYNAVFESAAWPEIERAIHKESYEGRILIKSEAKNRLLKSIKATFQQMFGNRTK